MSLVTKLTIEMIIFLYRKNTENKMGGNKSSQVGVSKFFSVRPHGKYLKHYRSHGLSFNYSTLKQP